MAIHIKTLRVLPEYRLQLTFEDGREVIYDVKEDAKTLPSYQPLLTEEGLFESVQLDPSNTCLIWTKEIDLPSDILYQYGTPVTAQ